MSKKLTHPLKSLLLFSLLAALTVLQTGCGGVIGSSQTVSLTKKVKDFSEVSIGSGFEGRILYGEKFSVKLHVSQNLQRLVFVNVSEERLSIGLRSGVPVFGGTLKVTVTMPSLATLSVSGGSRVSVTGFQAANKNTSFSISGGSIVETDFSSHKVLVKLSGGSRFRGTLQATHIDLRSSGGGRIELTGSAETLNVIGSGGSRFKLSRLNVQEAALSLSGGSYADINAEFVSDESLSGGSDYSNGELE